MTSVAPNRGLQAVITPNVNFLGTVKVMSPKNCAIENDRTLRESVIVMKGDLIQTRIHIPRDNTSSLQLRYSLLTSQIYLNGSDHFALELSLSQSAVQRLKLIIGTHIRDAQHESPIGGIPTLKLPLIIPRSKWVQVVFHIAGIVQNLFSMQQVQWIDSIALCGTAKIGRIQASSDEQTCIDSTPDGMALFAVPAYSPPIWSTAAAPAQSEKKEVPAVTAKTAEPRGDSAPDTHHRYREVAQSSIESTDSSTLATSAPTLLHGRSPRGVSLPARLEPLDGTNSSRRTSAPGTEDPKKPNETNAASQPTMLSSFREAASKGSGFSHHHPADSQPGGGYIRIVDEQQQNPPPPPRFPNNVPPRRFVNEAGSTPQRESKEKDSDATSGRGGGLMPSVPSTEWNDVSSWTPVDESEPEINVSASQSNQTTTRRNQSPKAKPKAAGGGGGGGGGDGDRMQRLIQSRKRKVAIVNPRGTTGNGRAAPLDDAPTRRSKSRRRMQILRANESKFNKTAAARNVLPSQIQVHKNDAILATPTGKGEAVFQAVVEPKVGYGFGYLGVLHEDGHYEEDEAADLCMKGALTLQLSDDGEE